MTNRFTDAQRRAIDSNARDICVSAGAGSGKTGVLVERFIRIITESISGNLPVTDRATVSEILVVTFTDRATKEMKSRIVSALTERGLIDERRQLETAYISTIHGLCSRLIREHPFEAGIDPGFTVIDEPTAQRMIRTAFDDVVADAYAGQDADITELIAEVIGDPTFKGSDLDSLPMLALEAEAIMNRLRGAGVTLREIKQVLETGKLVEPGVDPVQLLLRPTLTELAACIDDLRRMAVGAGGVVLRAVSFLLDVVSRMSYEVNIISRIENVKTINAASAKARSFVGASPSAAGLLLLLNRITAACSHVSELNEVSAEREAASKIACRRFTSLISKIWTLYEAAKQRSGFLDNQDLLAECVRLLEESPQVRIGCQRQFRHLMIDEFQDTDVVQMRLLKLLHLSSIFNFKHEDVALCETSVSHNNLFVVGDLQQSIYGFRNADPEIFHSLDRRFRDSSEGVHVQLTDNFRSRPEILGLVRQVFGAAWHGEPTPYIPLHSAAQFDSKPIPSIELLISMNLARREYVYLEADTIAARIRAIVEETDAQVRISAHNNPRAGSAAGYGDIAVLLRGFTDIRIYEEAFNRYNVPALVTAGGRGYYARYEIKDLLSALTLLDSPLDDVALLTVLRSPFVGADIDTVYRLAVLARKMEGKRERGPLYPALQHLLASPELPAVERDKILPFVSALDSLRIDVDRIPIGRLLDRLIVKTNYDMRLVCRPGGRRKLANVRKLVQIALAEPALSVREFLGRMGELQVLSDREGDAPTAEEGAGVVRLMTIHSAKGLEFPIVVLPDLSRGLVSPETGLFTCDPVSQAIGARTCGEPDATYRAIAVQRQEADKREYLRLLYVAMTRAREHLILCGNVGRNRGYNWADVVFPALGITSAPSAPTRLALNGSVDARVTPLSSSVTVPAGGMTSGQNGSANAALDQLVETLLRGPTKPEQG